MICSESISNLVYKKKIPKPNYIKIDVDGNEGKILFNLGNLMKGNNLKSILIEGRSELYSKYLKQYKFFLDEKFCDEINSCFTKEEYL
jgi:LEA14-like dessication related protein